MTHSPAPWKIVRASDYTDDPADTHIYSVYAANGQTILFTDSGYFKPREDDAKLIWAAPDLLAALNSLVKWMDDSGLSHTKAGGHGALTYSGTEYSVITDARTAIAKATS